MARTAGRGSGPRPRRRSTRVRRSVPGRSLLLLSLVVALCGWRKREPCLVRGGGGQRLAVVEEMAELLPDLAAACLPLFPLVGVDAEGGVGLAVPEPALDVDDGDVERDQHAGVAVPEVVQGRLGRCEPGGLDGALERLAGDLALQPGPGAAGEDERAWIEEIAALGDEREQT